MLSSLDFVTLPESAKLFNISIGQNGFYFFWELCIEYVLLVKSVQCLLISLYASLVFGRFFT